MVDRDDERTAGLDKPPFFDKSRTKLGYKPMSISPFYPPTIVADALLYAVENEPRDLVVGGAGKALLLT